MKITKYHRDVIHAKICPYCKSETKIISETEVYGREYKGRAVIACKNFPDCDSYVGTHEDGEALGRLADKNLRDRKKAAHYWFDKIWKEGFRKRSKMYHKMSEMLQLDAKYTHIGMFSEITCIKVESWAKEYYKKLKSSQK